MIAVVEKAISDSESTSGTSGARRRTVIAAKTTMAITQHQLHTSGPSSLTTSVSAPPITAS